MQFWRLAVRYVNYSWRLKVKVRFTIATCYGLDGTRIQSRWGARFSAPVQTGPGAHPSTYTMGTGSFPGVNRPGRGVDHPPLLSAEVKGRVELDLYSPLGHSWPVLGWTLLFIFSTESRGTPGTNEQALRGQKYGGQNVELTTHVIV